MCAAPAAELGITLAVLAQSPDDSAAQVIPASPVGEHTDEAAVLALAEVCDVVTFDHEHVPAEVLAAVRAKGVPMHPHPEALRFAQDKLAMRTRLTELGIACPRWAQAHTVAEVARFGDEVGWPVIAKTPRGGYDGRGVRLVERAEDLGDWLTRAREAGEGLLLEERVPFVRELAVLMARSPSGQLATWPVVETVQTDGICIEVIAPAPGLDRTLAEKLLTAGAQIAAALDVTGVFAIEAFETRTAEGEPGFVVNELAMRPHNSGHWSMDGAVTGQFEQHLRAVLDLPLGQPHARERWTVMANVLGGDYPDLYPAYRHVMARDPGAKIHMYGKGVRPGRKIGHVNVCGNDLADVRDRARHAADYIQGVVTE